MSYTYPCLIIIEIHVNTVRLFILKNCIFFSFAFYFCLTEQSHYISHAGISVLFFFLVAIALPFLHIPACYVWFHFLIAVPYLSIVMLHLDLSHNIMFHLIPPHCFISHPSHQIIFFSFHLIASYSIHLITSCSISVHLTASHSIHIITNIPFHSVPLHHFHLIPSCSIPSV